jgi:phosphatidylglycerophosphatase A
MKQRIDKRDPNGLLDNISLAVTTFGVGYLPLAPGTWGSLAGVAVYLIATRCASAAALSLSHNGWRSDQISALTTGTVAVLFLLFCLAGVWAAGRSCGLFGNSDPSQAVVDEVIGQLITFLFVPFGISWPYVLIGFALFRLFDVWKPYPIDSLQALPGGIGVCADDFLAGIYAGVALAVIYAFGLFI